MVFRLTFILFMSYTFLFPVSSYANVEVSINNTKHTFSDNPRLADVLYPVALQEDWYWPESKLYRSNTSNSLESREQIVSMLATESNGKYRSIYRNITNQLNSWEVADRININIDFELARISAKHNPLFENGQYRIMLSKRPTKIYVFGAVIKAFSVPYNNNTCIEDIMSTIEYSAFADKSYVHLISAKGKVEKSPIAYWNGECSLAMPGSMLYVPLKESLFSDANTIINTKIAELAVNRITKQ